MKALLIDPYQRKIHEIQIAGDVQARCNMLECGRTDFVQYRRNWCNTKAIDVWIDEEGATREPVPPLFTLRGRTESLAGYGLMLGVDLRSGKQEDCNICAANMDGSVTWEHWEKRLDPRDYFKQLTRVPGWEKV